ncbi:MAG TPA: hypothetical protein VK158_06340 [Acidobacteriota bacterium]|nr:hypothetical protein [Acidobacteriota bacterium]
MASQRQDFLRKKKKYAPIHMNLIHANKLYRQKKVDDKPSEVEQKDSQ